mgnify:CR=1 FL=1
MQTQSVIKKYHAAVKNGVPLRLRVYDRGEIFYMRYMVVFSGNYTKSNGGQYAWINVDPSGVTNTQRGFSMPDENFFQKIQVGEICRYGKRVNYQDLPQNVQEKVMDVYCELWNIPKLHQMKRMI